METIWHVFLNTTRLQISSAWDAVGNSSNAYLFMLYPSWQPGNNNGNLIGAQTYVGGPATQQALTLFNDTYSYDGVNRLTAASDLPTAPCYTCYLSYDHLGSTSLVTDQNAAVVARHDCLPFGEEIPGGSASRNSRWGVARFDALRSHARFHDLLRQLHLDNRHQEKVLSTPAPRSR